MMMRKTSIGYMTELEWRIIQEVDKNYYEPHAIVYTKPGCVRCRMTMKQLHLPIIQRTATDEDYAKFRAIGYQSMPVVEVVQEGKVIDAWSDFRADKIKQYA